MKSYDFNTALELLSCLGYDPNDLFFIQWGSCSTLYCIDVLKDMVKGYFWVDCWIINGREWDVYLDLSTTNYLEF